MMPIMSGYDALVAIRKNESFMGVTRQNRVKIAITTSINTSEQIQEAYWAECDAYMIKPLQRQALLKDMAQMGLISLEEAVLP